MAHIVFAAPGIDRFHLHDRLQRELARRMHATTTLCLDAGSAAFFAHQGMTVVCPSGEHAAAPAGAAPLAEFATIDERLGASRPRTRRRLRRLHAALHRWFDEQAVDLVLLHGIRDADHALLHFVARERGCRVLWTGDGLLPHTMQIDERGIDGDAAASHRRVMDYRVVAADPKLLAACLTHTLGGAAPFALTPRPVQRPPLWQRLAALPALWHDRGAAGALATLRGWRAARPGAAPTPNLDIDLPARPFVAVLLQPAHDPRRRLDATDVPTDAAMIAAAARAAQAIDPDLVVVAVEGRNRAIAPQPRQVDGVTVHTLPADAAATAAAAATATVTINHPAAAVALLAGTPVVHSGEALYGLPGVTTRSSLADLASNLRRALTHDHPALRQRFLTWLFGHGHLWCSATHPDHNGLSGLVQAIEARLAGPHGSPPLRYRSGPAWPLTVEPRP